jgi:hypothetical protein
MNHHERKIERVAPDGTVVEFSSLRLATKSVSDKYVDKSIRSRCRNGKSFAGYTWRYKDCTIPDEIWRDHPYLEIECSSLGRVRFRKCRISSGGLNGVKATYLRVHVGKKWYTLHRLIAETFHPNPENKPTVDHIDRDISNNKAENLRWATAKEQAANRSIRRKINFLTYYSHSN